MTDITFNHFIRILLDTLLASLHVVFQLSNEQLTSLTEDFESRLLEYLRNALHTQTVSA